METIYSKMRASIEGDKARYMCDALSLSVSWPGDKNLWSATKYEIDLALTHNRITNSSVEGYLIRAEACEKMSSEELRIVARQWRLDWLQKKHENATIKFTHEKYLPTTYRAKHHHIEDLVQIKHHLETVDGEPWVCVAIADLDLQHKQELDNLVEASLGPDYGFITSVAVGVKGASFSDEPRGLVFPDAPFLTRTQYRIGWIDWLINNTED